jgi:hypothetical protein
VRIGEERSGRIDAAREQRKAGESEHQGRTTATPERNIGHDACVMNRRSKPLIASSTVVDILVS